MRAIRPATGGLPVRGSRRSKRGPPRVPGTDRDHGRSRRLHQRRDHLRRDDPPAHRAAPRLPRALTNALIASVAQSSENRPHAGTRPRCGGGPAPRSRRRRRALPSGRAGPAACVRGHPEVCSGWLQPGSWFGHGGNVTGLVKSRCMPCRCPASLSQPRALVAVVGMCLPDRPRICGMLAWLAARFRARV